MRNLYLTQTPYSEEVGVEEDLTLTLTLIGGGGSRGGEKGYYSWDV